MIPFRLRIKIICFQIVSFIEKFVPKKKNLVLLTSWQGEKYIDNSKYVYEYLQQCSRFETVWMTNNKNIYRSLKYQSLPVCKTKSFRGIWLQLRASVLFSSIQLADYNSWLVNRCLYIDLGHGHPIKDPGKQHLTEEFKVFTDLVLKKIDYRAIVASDYAKKLYPQVINIPDDHIVISDFARNDVFIDPSLRVGKNIIIEENKKNCRVVVYMPTHRSMGAKTMMLEQILPLIELQNLCERNNILFVVKKHFFHRNEKESLNMYPNIIDVTNIDEIDPQVLLYQADVLVSDYSACYIDFLLLNRPILFYQYDIDSFISNERSLYYSFEDIDIAPVSKNSREFITDLENILNSTYDRYQEKRNGFTKTYFNNLQQDNGRQKVVDIMQALLNERK
jgi:CDP-glycerol glycerophosphotransferase (TagB/SpsB family)